MNLLAPTSAAHSAISKPCRSTIRLMAEDRFCASGYLSLRDVTCTVSDGVASLHGSLPSHYLKQLAQEIAATVEGVRLVVNKIAVKAPARPSRTAQAKNAF
jgi:osmotically-inducible protein OsmY